MTLLSLERLTVRFGGLTAVNAVSCEVEERQIFSIIGPNGAGKTTVFNAITGIYPPTEGEIRCNGRPLARTFGWQTLLGCIVAGLLMGLVAGLIALDVNSLWRATVKRNYTGDKSAFSYRAAWDNFLPYVRGELALERRRGGRWAVVSADGRKTFGYAPSKLEAEKLRDRLQRLIGLGSNGVLVEQNGRWMVIDPRDKEIVGEYPTREQATGELERFGSLEAERARSRRAVWIALVGGTLLGGLGAFAVWNRSRRSPEVVARAGIARTFQNIRLFQNMTVMENVLIGMDRWFKSGSMRMALRTPGARREERESQARAIELLRFVGLADMADALAKNLPYGDQRRLEIARALATRPQLILLDEPAAGMNPTESSDLMKLIERIRAQGIGVLLIEHHMKVVMGISDHVAVLDYGVKIAEGTPQEVRSNPEVIKAYLGSEEVT